MIVISYLIVVAVNDWSFDRYTLLDDKAKAQKLIMAKIERGYNPETPLNFPHHSSVMLTG